MDDVDAIRRWARQNDIAIGARGRLPRRILQMYADAASSNQEGRTSETFTRYELLAKYLEPRFGSIYAHDFFEWNDDLRELVRQYLLKELPADVRDVLFDTPEHIEQDDSRRQQLVDELLVETELIDVALAVHRAAVFVVPTLDQLLHEIHVIGLCEWPSQDERDVTATWLGLRASDQQLANIALWFAEHQGKRSLPIRSDPDVLVSHLSPVDLLQAWEYFSADPSPGDLTDTEWQILQPFLPQQYGYYNPQVRRTVDGMLYCFERKISISEVPKRYGRPGLLVSQRYRYRRAGIYQHALSELDGTAGGERLVAWLHEMVKPPEAA